MGLKLTVRAIFFYRYVLRDKFTANSISEAYIIYFTSIAQSVSTYIVILGLAVHAFIFFVTTLLVRSACGLNKYSCFLPGTHAECLCGTQRAAQL